MRTATLSLLFAAVLGLASPAAQAADPPKGLWLTTDFPSATARPGEITTVRVKLQNAGLPPEVVSLSVTGVPQGWKVDLLGGGQPVTSAMPGSNESVSLNLRVEAPAKAAPGSYPIVIQAKTAGATTELPMTLGIGGEVAAKLSMKVKLPELRGTPKSTFDYTFTVSNDSGKDAIVRFGADMQKGFTATFTEAYGANELSSIPIEAGQSKEIKVAIKLPRDIAAGSYPARIRAEADGASAQTQVTLLVQGTPTLRLAGKDGRLSAEAQAGSASQLALVLSNDGTAAAEEIELSGTVPQNWKIEFNPKTVDKLGPGEKKDVVATLTPFNKALAGDYQSTLRASTKGDSVSSDFRITVATSTLWGITGVGIIAVALLVLVGAVARFGRR
ncbi:NEW3 domain-containing protein [Vineibacter terrae]|uniref:NEW3 domain-containing protein n=1 Tax=Vineibacter terrae TaxID=2586908 RepID=UPI002E36260A|nr:NEW3 domain-containing protein [Vineibacter terrae]HEX2887412.1 NEW3 domain-containing protein [Vineibacter terrae]